MRLTVLGKSPSWQDAGGACSGYLIEEEGTTVLVDCGNGVFAKLREHIDYIDLDAVVISHLHADHFLDLVPYSYALTYAPRQQPVPVDRWPGTDFPARPELHVPPGAQEVFRRVVGAWGNDDLIENAFHLREYDPSKQDRDRPDPDHVPGGAALHRDLRDEHRLHERLRADRVRRRLEPDGCPRGVRAGGRPDARSRPRCRGRSGPGCAAISRRSEAGGHARGAAAKRLLLVHISDELDANWARDEAAEAFGGPVEVATEGAVFEV